MGGSVCEGERREVGGSVCEGGREGGRGEEGVCVRERRECVCGREGG